MLRIENIKIEGIQEAIRASGLPKSTGLPTYSEERAIKLGRVKSGSGHDCFLKGIVVWFDVIYPEYWSPQFQRYHFADIVSSQSKMHCVLDFDIKNQCNEYVDSDAIERISTYKKAYNAAKTEEERYFYFMKIISNLPCGFEKRMRVVTNYLQLKTIYLQRKNHKLKEDWGAFCDFVLKLPSFKKLTGVKEEEE